MDGAKGCPSQHWPATVAISLFCRFPNFPFFTARERYSTRTITIRSLPCPVSPARHVRRARVRTQPETIRIIFPTGPSRARGNHVTASRSQKRESRNFCMVAIVKFGSTLVGQESDTTPAFLSSGNSTNFERLFFVCQCSFQDWEHGRKCNLIFV